MTTRARMKPHARCPLAMAATCSLRACGAFTQLETARDVKLRPALLIITRKPPLPYCPNKLSSSWLPALSDDDHPRFIASLTQSKGGRLSTRPGSSC